MKSVCTAAILLLVSLPASAAPITLHFEGRVIDSTFSRVVDGSRFTATVILDTHVTTDLVSSDPTIGVYAFYVGGYKFHAKGVSVHRDTPITETIVDGDPPLCCDEAFLDSLDRTMRVTGADFTSSAWASDALILDASIGRALQLWEYSDWTHTKTLTASVSTVPEPSLFLLLGLGFIRWARPSRHPLANRPHELG